MNIPQSYFRYAPISPSYDRKEFLLLGNASKFCDFEVDLLTKNSLNFLFLSLLLARSRRVLANREERIQKFIDTAFFWPVEVGEILKNRRYYRDFHEKVSLKILSIFYVFHADLARLCLHIECRTLFCEKRDFGRLCSWSYSRERGETSFLKDSLYISHIL